MDLLLYQDCVKSCGHCLVDEVPCFSSGDRYYGTLRHLLDIFPHDGVNYTDDYQVLDNRVVNKVYPVESYHSMISSCLARFNIQGVL